MGKAKNSHRFKMRLSGGLKQASFTAWCLRRKRTESGWMKSFPVLRAFGGVLEAPLNIHDRFLTSRDLSVFLEWKLFWRQSQKAKSPRTTESSATKRASLGLRLSAKQPTHLPTQMPFFGARHVTSLPRSERVRTSAPASELWYSVCSPHSKQRDRYLFICSLSLSVGFFSILFDCILFKLLLPKSQSAIPLLKYLWPTRLPHNQPLP
jgi:hypothetical protein